MIQEFLYLRGRRLEAGGAHGRLGHRPHSWSGTLEDAVEAAEAAAASSV